MCIRVVIFSFFLAAFGRGFETWIKYLINFSLNTKTSSRQNQLATLISYKEANYELLMQGSQLWTLNADAVN